MNFPHDISLWISIWEYFAEFLIPLILRTFPTALAEIHLQTKTEPSLCFTGGGRHSLLYRFPDLLCTYWW